MGYFTNAFIFDAQPRFDAIAAGFPTCSVRGYQHVSRPTWLLDLWTPKQVQHFPFRTQAGPATPSVSTPADTTTRRFLDEFQALVGALAGCADIYGLDECQLALSVADRAATPAFFVVSDDEFSDFACWATPAGALERLRCRFGDIVVIVNESGVAFVEPNFYPEDGEYRPPADLIAAVHRSVPWPVAEPVPLVGGRPLFGNALALWPASAGDPDDLLGCNAFENLDRDYRLTFERLA